MLGYVIIFERAFFWEKNYIWRVFQNWNTTFQWAFSTENPYFFLHLWILRKVLNIFHVAYPMSIFRCFRKNNAWKKLFDKNRLQYTSGWCLVYCRKVCVFHFCSNAILIYFEVPNLSVCIDFISNIFQVFRTFF